MIFANGPLHISHRGGTPENTIEAFETAVHLWKTDVLELDVHTSRDGVLVVAHDETLERCTNGTGRIDAYDWSALCELTVHADRPHVRLPRLEEVLERFPRTLLNIELKSESAIAPFVRVMKRELHRACIGSEHDTIAEQLVARLPDACHFYPRDALTLLVMSVHAGMEPPKDDRYSVLDMPLYHEGARVFHPDLLKLEGKWVNVWTVNEREEMERCVREGIGGIMTDRPDVLREVLDKAIHTLPHRHTEDMQHA